jgi:hypothetical protein
MHQVTRLSHRFLEAYTAVAPLSLADLDRAAEAYSSMRAHDLWLYEAVYGDGNERVRHFLPGGPLVPLWEPWRPCVAVGTGNDVLGLTRRAHRSRAVCVPSDA